MDKEHERIFDKIGELHVDVAIVQTQMAGVVKAVDQLCGKVDGIQSNEAKQSSKITDALLGMIKYVLVALLAGGVAGGTLQAYTGQSAEKAPVAITQSDK